MIKYRPQQRLWIVVSILVISIITLFATTLHINQEIEMTTESTMATITTSIATTTEIATEPETSSTTKNKTTTTTETTTEKTTKKKQTTTTKRETTSKKEKKTTKSKSEDAKYSASQFRKAGVLHWGGWRWTWYSERVLPGNGLRIPGRHTDDNGYVCDENNYICLASSTLKHGSIIDTPLGKQGKIYDSGCASDTIDVYVNW